MTEESVKMFLIDGYCPWVLRRVGRRWLCRVREDICTHDYPASCGRYEIAMKIINDPLSQELIKKAMES